eukprot:TRINITY_DN2523_c0_g2_i3.p1 TRINITY_DN2523_c0_g2~~TRINITY_DN2523_c0_g2_i3.p1  ORF type:complete len:199 (+),score=24.23 TRINITY_DN2523_c0_g2_i3:169-765(+)
MLQEKSHFAHRVDSFSYADRYKADYLVIGNIHNDDFEVDKKKLDSTNPGTLFISSFQMIYGRYCGFIEDEILYAGRHIRLKDGSPEYDNKGQPLLEGYMIWPDGYSFSGKCNTSDEFIEQPIHPKIQECLENNTCTRHAGVVGPQMSFQHTRDEAYCMHCKENCQQETEGDYFWTYNLTCKCRCRTCLLYTSPSPRDA